jgi:prolipoprotein diacylglyceryltransferase
MQLYLISYGVWRIFIEFFRTDYRGAFVLGMSPSQWQSIFFILGGIALLIFYKLTKKPYKLTQEYYDQLKEPETNVENKAE